MMVAMNPLAIKIIAGLSLAFVLYIGWNHYRDVRADRDRYKTERNQARVDLQQCNDDKVLTEKASHDFQTKFAGVRRQLDRLNSVRERARCVAVTAEPAARPDGTGAGEVVPGRSGINSGWLYDFAARCEETRLKAQGLQQFNTEVWNSR